MRIEWSPEAIEDLVSLRDYIAEDSPSAAEKVVRRVIECVERLLSENADIGRAGRVLGTRELVVTGTPYIVPYRVKQNSLQVLRVYHGARRWPEQF